MKKWMIRIAVGLAALYAIICAVAATTYRKFLYPAPTTSSIPSDAKKVESKTSDGTTAYGLRFGPDDARATVFFFHGNGEVAEDNVDIARALASHDYGVVLAEYRGYGMSKAAGSPTERALYADAEALLAGYPPERIIVMGFSLGTGVAVEMAARGKAKALVLMAPYTSIPDVAVRHVPVLPLRLVMGDRFDSQSKAAAIQLPALVIHGDVDPVVPFDMGETIAHTFPHGRFVPVAGGHHGDLFASDDHLMQKLLDFLIDVAP